MKLKHLICEFYFIHKFLYIIFLSLTLSFTIACTSKRTTSPLVTDEAPDQFDDLNQINLTDEIEEIITLEPTDASATDELNNDPIIQPVNTGSWSTVSSGTLHTCGINLGKLYCWGSDAYGQLGNGPIKVASLNAPDQVLNVGQSFEDDKWQVVSAGGSHTCGINAGNLYCWGSNGFGQIKYNFESTDRIHSPESPLSLSIANNWTHVFADNMHTCGIESGNLYCWGATTKSKSIEYFELWRESSYPLVSSSTGGNWTMAGTGKEHACGIEQGQLYCRGKNTFGQLGDSDLADTNVAIGYGVGNEPTLWTDIAPGGDHTCGIGSNGKVYCWGANFDGQLGDGLASGGRFPVPTPVKLPSEDLWSQVTAGNQHNCAINNSQQLYCWGFNSHSQVFDKATTDSVIDTPIEVDFTGDASQWSYVSAGGYHTCGINNGDLFCWGRNDFYQTGTGSTTAMMSVTTPTLVSEP